MKLEVFTTAVPMGSVNSLKGRGYLMHLMTGQAGLVVFVAKESGGAFAEDEVWYVIIWMMEEKVLYLLNASARLAYNIKADSNNQVFLLNELAEKEGLGARLNKDEVRLEVEEFLVREMVLADLETWHLVTGLNW